MGAPTRPVRILNAPRSPLPFGAFALARCGRQQLQRWK